jgi:hypothetical protein
MLFGIHADVIIHSFPDSTNTTTATKGPCSSTLAAGIERTPPQSNANTTTTSMAFTDPQNPESRMENHNYYNYTRQRNN